MDIWVTDQELADAINRLIELGYSRGNIVTGESVSLARLIDYIADGIQATRS